MFPLTRRSLLLVGALSLHEGPAVASVPAVDPIESALARLAHWPRAVMQLVVKYQQNPLRAARALAYVQVALHHAWVQAAGTGPQATALAEAAAHGAASQVMAQLYPNETAGTFEAREALFTATLALPPAAQAQAHALGLAVGQALIARSLRDGAGRAWPPRQRPPDFPGAWQPTWPLYAANPAEGLAGEWKPFATRSAARHDPPPAPRPGSARHRLETQEVLAVARSLDNAQRSAAQAWHLDAGSVTPAGVWMQRGLAALVQEAASAGTVDLALGMLLPGATTLAVAMHDAFIDCWRVKMRDWSERPITAVRRELDPGFEPLLVTPGFPSYVSGHAAVSAAAAEVLGHFMPARREAFEAMAQEAAMSRLWGGIHFRSDNEEGLRLGRSVARDVLASRVWQA